MPNRSLTWLQSKWVVAFIGAFCLTIAIVWSLLGAWFVLPFAGLEVTILALVMYLVSRASYQQQQLLFHQDNILVLKGFSHRCRQWCFVRSKTRVYWQETNHPEDVRQLFLSDDNQKTAIGDFLNLEDQQQLLKHCQQLGLTTEEHKKPVQVDF
ncbi:MAG: DUF2244 domain-containing protein [Aestuariibacter sp.]